MVKQIASFTPAWRAALAYPMDMALTKTEQACLMICSEQDLFRPCFEQAVLCRSDAKSLSVSGDAAEKAKAIFDFIQAQAGAH